MEGLKFEDRMEGYPNFYPLREHIRFMLKRNGLLEFFEGKETPQADPIHLAFHLKKDVKMRRIIMDGVKDQIIPHLFGKNIAKEMWDALVKCCTSMITRVERCCLEKI
jgi:hypothetical protein